MYFFQLTYYKLLLLSLSIMLIIKKFTKVSSERRSHDGVVIESLILREYYGFLLIPASRNKVLNKTLLFQYPDDS